MNGVSLGQTGNVTVVPARFRYGQENVPPSQHFNGMAFQPPLVQHAVANISAQEINHIREPTLQLARSTGTRPGLLPSAETRYGIQAGSPAQLFINHQVNNLIREIQQVRPHFTYNSIRPAGQPYNQHDIDALQQTIAPIRAELLAKLPGVHATLANGMSLGDLNEQVQYKTYLANGGKASFMEWSTEKPSSPEKSVLTSDQSYSSKMPLPLELSKKLFGHTFSKHGEEATTFLQKRAAASGQAQGQFTDNQAAAQLIQDNLHKLKNGAISVPIPSGFPARMINPDGSFSAASHVRLVPSGDGVKTAYPEF